MVRFPFANWYTRIRDPLAQSRKKIGRKWTRYTRWYTRVDSRKDEFVCTERHQELLEEGRRSCSQNRDRDAMSVSALSVRFPPPLSLFLSPTPLLDTSPSFESIFQVSWILRWNSFVFGVDLPLFASLSLPGFLFLSTRGGLLTRDYLAVYIYIARRLVSMEERGIFFQTVILPIRKRSIIGVAIVFWKYYLFIYWIYWIFAKFIYYKFIGHVDM